MWKFPFLYFPAASESLEINFKVSSALVEIVRRISTRPRYILAKVFLDITFLCISFTVLLQVCIPTIHFVLWKMILGPVE